MAEVVYETVKRCLRQSTIIRLTQTFWQVFIIRFIIQWPTCREGSFEIFSAEVRALFSLRLPPVKTIIPHSSGQSNCQLIILIRRLLVLAVLRAIQVAKDDRTTFRIPLLWCRVLLDVGHLPSVNLLVLRDDTGDVGAAEATLD